jgi:5-methylcytosine-specific restriction endonuclease McrA
VCGALQNLEVHHRQFRSRMGSDSKQNLITLCAQCHAKMHNSKSN